MSHRSDACKMSVTVAGPSNVKTVLVVDDDPDIQALLADLLSRAGFAVETATNGAEAIETLEDGTPPDAILTDLMMPGLIGNELIEYITDTHQLDHVPVAIISACPERAPAGFRVFPKPVRFGPILAYLEEALSTANAEATSDAEATSSDTRLASGSSPSWRKPTQ